ncbi:NHLP bacteriocin export ABC transporter permease/ATPase subunit [Oscillospiraceae bacterium LTW-04]|nr:NHLP bacteriocin export ABC transporter permease/ATPase subunit [Oscillospiraceae bacterium MB24-C1]
MGWFDEQIKTRIKKDNENFESSFIDLSSVVMGKGIVVSTINNNRKKTKNAIDEILRYYHVNSTDLPEQIKDLNAQLEYLMHPSGIMRREVKLEGTWYKDSIGPLLGYTQDGDTIALLPKKISGYEYFDWKSGKKVSVTKKNASTIKQGAICFYKSFPIKKLATSDLFKFILKALSPADYAMAILSTLTVTILGLFMPYASQLVFEKVIPSGKTSALLPIAILLFGVTLSSSMITVAKSLVMTRIQTKVSVAVESASMARILSLPAEFFKNYSAGDLTSRIQNVNLLCEMLAEVFLTTGLSSILSIVYIGQIFIFAPSLAIPALAIILTSITFSVVSTFTLLKVSRKKLKISAKIQGLVFSLFSGVQKIKIAGAERRAFSKWAETYKEEARLQYDPPLLIKISPAITTAIAMAGTMGLFYLAAVSKVSVANYLAFSASFALVSGALNSVSAMSLTIANIKPVAEMIEPILNAEPELAAGKQVLARLSGTIELNKVSFRYNEKMPLVIDNLSLKIRAGQYVAIVGETGCGKSTLLRLVLGFEKPQKGAIYYDGKDIQKIDLKSLRQNIGVVMQNGKLFTGDIYSNIVISAPWLPLDSAWEAAELAGIANDIRNMPMGMHTIITEGSGGISGGQRQRLMIARAIAPKPKILMFDEATSALDNITQRQISDSLEKLKSTRIVIAHRLSTIKQCDRIIVFEKGKIVQDGTYEELMQTKGYFSDLVRHQCLDVEYS